MSGTQRRTREQLRRSIGRNLIGHRLIVTSATSDGDTTGLIDDTLLGGDDNYNGWWFVATSPMANAGTVRRVSDYDSASTRLSWTRPLPEATVVNDSYELWPSEYPPEVIHDYINQAIERGGGPHLRAGRGRVAPRGRWTRAVSHPGGRRRDLEGAGQGIGGLNTGPPGRKRGRW